MSEQAKTPEGQKNQSVATKTDPPKNDQTKQQNLAKPRRTAWQPKDTKLDAIDLAIIRERIAKPTISILEIATKLDLNRDTIGRRLASERVQKILDDQAKHVAEVLQESVDDAARVLRELLKAKGLDKKTNISFDSPSYMRIRLEAAKTILEGLGQLKSYQMTEVKTTAEEAERKIMGYAERYGMSMEEYCKKEGIDLTLIRISLAGAREEGGKGNGPHNAIGGSPSQAQKA